MQLAGKRRVRSVEVSGQEMMQVARTGLKPPKLWFPMHVSPTGRVWQQAVGATECSKNTTAIQSASGEVVAAPQK